MFEDALLSGPSPGVDPVAVDVAWHPERGEWVALDPCDLVDSDLDARLGGLAACYAAVPVAGVFPFDADEVPVGPELAGLVDRFDPARADGYDVVEVVAALGRLGGWVEAKRAAALAALAARPELRPDTTGYRSVNPVSNTAVEVAGRCRLSTRQAENQVGHALQLVGDFPDTHAALAAGLIDLRRARVITDELGGQEPPVRERVEAAVLPKAPGLDSVALRALVRRLLLELAPVETAERQRVARDGRYVSVTPASDGMAFLEARLPAEDAAVMDTALNVAAADAKRADTAAGLPARTRDQRRADALAGLGRVALAAYAEGTTGNAAAAATAASGHAADNASGGRTAAGEVTHRAAASGGPPSTDTLANGDMPSSGDTPNSGTPARTAAAMTAPPRRRPVSVQVTIPFAALAGLTDQPGELDGYGPIPAHVARQLATEGVWTWLAHDPGTGQLLDLGRTRYRPTKALADFVTARDRTCRTPGCHRSARACDIDHLVPFAAGGTTDPANCHALCETHHLLKHHGGWGVQRDRDGTTRWRSPTGHRYVRDPDPCHGSRWDNVEDTG